MGVAAGSDEDLLQSLLAEDWRTAAAIAAILALLWVVTPRIVRPLMRYTAKRSTGKFQDGGATAIELAKRSETIGSLTVTLVRTAIGVVLAIMVVAFLGLWWLLAGVGILLAALTLAGQPIVLDLLTGLTIIGEGPFFEGDNIAVGDPKFKIFGTVEKVGLRHTVLRAPDGTVHSVSNRFMGQSSNRTRAFAGADVTVRGIRETDFARVLQIMNRAGLEVAEDRRFANAVIEPLTVAYVGDPDDLGWSATMRGKVVAGERWAVGTEVRTRIVGALRDSGIDLNRRGVTITAPPLRGADAPSPVPPSDEDHET